MNDEGEGPVIDGRRPGGYDDAVASDDFVVVFLYLLGRDHLPLGAIETLIRQAVACTDGVQFSNDFLAAYAVRGAARLRGMPPEEALRMARRLFDATPAPSSGTGS